MRSMAIRGEGASLMMDPNDIGGGKVMWPFTMRGQYMKRGTVLTAEQIMSINPANRSSLIGRFIRVWPKAPGAEGLASPLARAEANRAERHSGASPKARHVVPLGFGHYHVVEGERITDEPLSREEAHELAGIPVPKKRGEKEH